MTDVWKTFERGRQWQVLQKYALRFASQKVSEELRELWLETAAECEKNFKEYQRKLKATTKKA